MDLFSSELVFLSSLSFWIENHSDIFFFLSYSKRLRHNNGDCVDQIRECGLVTSFEILIFSGKNPAVRLFYSALHPILLTKIACKTRVRLFAFSIDPKDDTCSKFEAPAIVISGEYSRGTSFKPSYLARQSSESTPAVHTKL